MKRVLLKLSGEALAGEKKTGFDEATVIEVAKLMPGRVMVLLVCSGAVLSAVGIYKPLVDFAGAGASVPLIGFGHVLWEGMKKAIEEDGILGLFTGGFTACAAGVSSALIFSYLASFFFRPKMKK